jgi:hypothetical protein
MSWVNRPWWLHIASVTTFFFIVLRFLKNLCNGLICKIALLLSDSYSMGWRCKVIGLTKLRKINLIGWILPHDSSVFISDFVIFSYGIRSYTIKISLFWKTEDFIITIIDSFSSLVLQFTDVLILSVFPIISH